MAPIPVIIDGVKSVSSGLNAVSDSVKAGLALKEAIKSKKSAKEQSFARQTQHPNQQRCPSQQSYPEYQQPSFPPQHPAPAPGWYLAPSLYTNQPLQTVDKRFANGGGEHLTMEISETLKIFRAGPEVPAGRERSTMPLQGAVKPSSARPEVLAREKRSVPGTGYATGWNKQVPGAPKSVFKR